MAETAAGATMPRGRGRVDVAIQDHMAARMGRLQLGVAYVLAFVIAYVLLIVPNFDHTGLVDRPARDGSFIVASLLALLPTPWLARRADRPSDVALWILYLSAYVPSILVPPLVLGSGWELLGLWLTLAASFVGVLAVVGRVRIRIPGPRPSPVVYDRLLAVLLVAGVGLVVAIFGLPEGIPTLDQVTSTRIDYREDAADAGRIAGYAVWWAGAALAPVGIAYGAWRRRPLLIAAGIVALVLVYGSTAFRSMIFIGLLTVILVILVSRVPRTMGPWLAGLASLLIVGCGVVVALGWLTPASLLVRRLLVVPGQVIAYYYDFFTNNPPYLMSHSILGGLVARPYPESPPALIGVRYFNDPLVNANGNLWADGLANFGLVGVVIASVGLAVVLIGLDAVSVGRPRIVSISVIAVGIWGLTNSALLTTLMTHGLLLTGALVWLLPSERDRVSTGPIVHLVRRRAPGLDAAILAQASAGVRPGRATVLIAPGTFPPSAAPIEFVTFDAGRGWAAGLVTGWRTFRAAVVRRPDIVHVHDPELLVVGLALKLAGARLVYGAHDDVRARLEGRPGLPPRIAAGGARLAGVGEQIAVSAVDAVVAATPDIARRMPPEATVIVTDDGPPPNADRRDATIAAVIDQLSTAPDVFGIAPIPPAEATA